MNEQDMKLSTDGMGIVFFSPETVKEIPEGINFLQTEYQKPADVAEHLKKGDVVGFCTGSGGDFILKFREGYPTDEISQAYPVTARLGIEIKDGRLCAIDLFWLSEWCADCPEAQTVQLPSGFYHITLCTRCPESGCWGDDQTIYVYLNRMEQMPELAWNGVPQLFTE